MAPKQDQEKTFNAAECEATLEYFDDVLDNVFGNVAEPPTASAAEDSASSPSHVGVKEPSAADYSAAYRTLVASPDQESSRSAVPEACHSANPHPDLVKSLAWKRCYERLCWRFMYAID